MKNLLLTIAINCLPFIVFAETEPNDVVGQADSLGINGSDAGALSAGDLNDWWKVTVPSDGKLTINTVSDVALELDLYLYDINGTAQIGYGGVWGVNESVVYNNLMPGIYFIRAYRYSGGGNYTINSSFIATAFANDAENNDSVQVANTLALNGSSTGHMGFYSNGFTDTKDWYKITIPSDGKLVVNTTSDATAEIDLFLYDIDSTTQIASYDIAWGINEATHYNNLMAGTYFVKVNRYGTTTNYGSYTISNTFTAATLSNDAENNDSMQVANTLTLNGSSTGHMGFYSNGFTDTRDWYSITIPSDGKLVVNTTSDTTAEIDLFMYDVNGTSQIASYDSAWGINEATHYNNLMAGTYFVKVNRYGATTNYGSYTISNTFTAAILANDPGPNEVKTQAQNLPVNNFDTGHLGYFGNQTTDVDDWWKITISQNGNLWVNTLSNAGLCIVSYLYDQDTVTGLANTWSPPCSDTSRTMVAYSVVPGTYFIKCNRYSGYGSYTITDTLFVAPAINTQPASSTICANNNAAFTVNATGGSLTYQWQEDQGAGFANLSNSGVYSGVNTATLSITGATTGMNGYNYRCNIDDNITLTPTATTSSASLIVNPLPFANAGADVTICTSTSTTLNASGNGSYAWSPATGLSCTTCANPEATPTATTSYTVTVTNSCGSATDEIIVTISTTPSVNAGADASICIGSTTTLNSSGSGTYLWSPSTGLSCTTCANPEANPTATTNYTLTITAPCGSATDEVSVTVNSLPSVTISGTTTVCSGTNTTLTGNGAIIYSWTGGPNSANYSVAPTTNTTYTVTGTDANNCSSTATQLVTVNPLPAVSINGSSAVCLGETTTLTASGANTYVWASGPSTAAYSVSPTSNTSYTVTGTDANNCSNTATHPVTVNQLPTVSISGTSIICSGGNTTLTASGANTYVWASGPSTAAYTVSPTSNTTYTVTGTDANSCSNTATQLVSVNALPTVSINGNMALCTGDCSTLTASGGISYLWSTGSGNAFITDCPTTTTAYTVTATDANGCSATATSTITVSPPPTASIAGNSTVCSGQNSTLSASGGGIYLWNTGATSASIIVNPSVTTTYSVIVSVGSCSDTASVTVNVNSAPVVSATATDASCSSCCDGSSTASTTGNAPFSYSWSGGQTTQSVTGLCTGNYTVCVTDANGCVTCDTVNVSFTIGISSHEFSGIIAISPNPTNGIITVQSSEMISEIKIINVLGEPVFNKTLNSKQETIVLNEPSGIYFLHIKTTEGVAVKKIIKQ